MLGATHALANPLTADYGIVHGQAIGLMLPHVIRFNGMEVAEMYHELLEATGGANGFPKPSEGVEGLAKFVAGLVEKAGLPRRLEECGVERDRLAELSEAAATQWTGGFNPRKVGPEELQAIYEQSF